MWSRFDQANAIRAAERGSNTLWYLQPAGKWEEALPVGNGRLGAMIFGGVEKERLQLNEITLWSGKLEPDADRPESHKSLSAIRQMIKEGKYADVVKQMIARTDMQDRRSVWAGVLRFVSDAGRSES